MSAKSRARKFNKKRRVTDDSYAERYRKNSEAAKRAREAARGRDGSKDSGSREEGRDLLGREVVTETIFEARLESPVIFEESDREREYYDEAGWLDREEFQKEYSPSRPFKEVGEEFIRNFETGISGEHIEFDPPIVGDLGFSLHPEEKVRMEAASDSEALPERSAAGSTGQSPTEQGPEPQEWSSSEALEVVQAILEAKRGFEEESRKLHWVFFEATVNDIPEHVATSTCFCEIGVNHWKELGEI